MAAPQPKTESLVLTRQYAAPPEAVFRAWVDPQALKRWYAPADDFQTPEAEVDPRVGGRYRIKMIGPDGRVHCVFGRYLEFHPPERLVFTWAWENDAAAIGETLVTVELRDLGGRTELVLTHERFPAEDVRDRHEHGHSGCLDRLQRYLASAAS
jgi:uncharacterized protein YndB with AHSA1/START domain